MERAREAAEAGLAAGRVVTALLTIAVTPWWLASTAGFLLVAAAAWVTGGAR